MTEPHRNSHDGLIARVEWLERAERSATESQAPRLDALAERLDAARAAHEQLDNATREPVWRLDKAVAAIADRLEALEPAIPKLSHRLDEHAKGLRRAGNRDMRDAEIIGSIRSKLEELDKGLRGANARIDEVEEDASGQLDDGLRGCWGRLGKLEKRAADQGQALERLAVAGVSAKLAELDRADERTGERISELGVHVDNLEGLIDGQRIRLEAAEKRDVPFDDPSVSKLDRRLEKQATDQALSRLGERVTILEGITGGSLSMAQLASRVEGWALRIRQIEEGEALPVAAPDKSLERVDELAKRLAKLEDLVNADCRHHHRDSNRLEDRLEAVEGQLEQLEGLIRPGEPEVELACVNRGYRKELEHERSRIGRLAKRVTAQGDELGELQRWRAKELAGKLDVLEDAAVKALGRLDKVEETAEATDSGLALLERQVDDHQRRKRALARHASIKLEELEEGLESTNKGIAALERHVDHVDQGATAKATGLLNAIENTAAEVEQLREDVCRKGRAIVELEELDQSAEADTRALERGLAGLEEKLCETRDAMHGLGAQVASCMARISALEPDSPF